jgi:hypothetical protein
MSRMADRRVEDRERGAVLVMAALLLTGLMVMAAIVVDLGHMRGMRRSSQSLVDFAALAAGEAMSAQEPDGPGGCADAVRYLRVNAPNLTGVDLDCDTLPSVCEDFTQPRTVTWANDEYDVAVTFPVSDTMISDALTGGGRADDGEPCERLMVEVVRRSPSFFGGIVGRSELETAANAVIRQVAEKADQVPSLWLLEPYRCDALTVSGGSHVTAGVPNFGGLISLDSDGSACTGNNSFVVDVSGTNSLLEAFPTDVFPPGRIELVAMKPGQQGCADPNGNKNACDPADVADGRLRPEPTRRPRRATRAPVDHRFNCRNESTPITTYPTYHGLTIDPCTVSSGDYIDQLVSVARTGTPTGFSVKAGAYCNQPAGYWPVDGNTIIDCSTFNVGNGTTVDFTGGNVIFTGDIRIANGGTVRFNTANPSDHLSAWCLTHVTGACVGESSAAAAWVYQRSGDIDMSGGLFEANHVAFYQHGGYFRMTGGLPVWSAPTEGPFTSLAYWSEAASNRFQITGGAEMELTGIFFMPHAHPFTLNGGAPLIPQQAQLIARSAAISGGARLTLAPLEIDPIIIPPPAPLLIR